MDKQRELPERRECENCGNSHYPNDTGKIACKLTPQEYGVCILRDYFKWEPEGMEEGILSAKDLEIGRASCRERV